MLTTEHPIPLADVMTMLLFSVIWNALSGLTARVVFETVGLLRTRSSIVSGTESLINLQSSRPSARGRLSKHDVIQRLRAQGGRARGEGEERERG